jgi:hypothetical protein
MFGLIYLLELRVWASHAECVYGIAPSDSFAIVSPNNYASKTSTILLLRA